jgi:hypothetical protein
MSELQILLGENSQRSPAAPQVCMCAAHESRFSAIDVESAFRSAIGWPNTRCGTSRSIWIGTLSGSICMHIRASTLLQLLSVDCRCSDHINQTFKITIKKESDDDDG